MITVEDILKITRKWCAEGCVKGSANHLKMLDIYNSHTPLARNYKVKPNDSWCATFVSTMFIILEAEKIIGGTECSCGKMIEKMKKAGIWIEDEKQKPRPGDIVMYDWDGQDGWPEHVGIVESVVGNVITVIEGNYSNKVARRTFNHGWNMIRGYGRPKYDKTLDDVNHNSPKKPTSEIAKEVIHGVWGNGSTRNANLKKAGYDPKAVQECVNEILASHPNQKYITTIAKEVINGEWGNGATRNANLKKAGYDPVAIQQQVNLLLAKG